MRSIALFLGLVGCVCTGGAGLLAAIMIPNVLSYGCKSGQQEAKVELFRLYEAEKAFYAEYGFYTSDLVSVGWSPSGTPRYIYGFSHEGPLKMDLPASGSRVPQGYDPSRKDTANPDVVSPAYLTRNMADLTGQPLSGNDLPGDTWADAAGFRAAAVGDIDVDEYPPRLDVWVIDHNGTISSLENDCRN